MNLAQMKNVIVIAQEKSFSRAAKRLFVSQPSLSKSIRLLEEELGVELFERTPFNLTYAGEIFIEKARKILRETDEMHTEISDISLQNKSQLTIGVPSHRCHYFVPKILKELYKEYPNCFIKLEEHSTDILKKMLKKYKMDFFIGTENPDTNIYTSELICKEKIFVAYPTSWNIKTEGDLVNLREFKGKNFISLPNQLPLGHYEKKVFDKLSIDIPSIMECHNAETARAMVKEELGFSFLPELYVKFLPKDDVISYKKIMNSNYVREFSIYYKKGKYLTKPAKRFIELFKSIV